MCYILCTLHKIIHCLCVAMECFALNFMITKCHCLINWGYVKPPNRFQWLLLHSIIYCYVAERKMSLYCAVQLHSLKHWRCHGEGLSAFCCSYRWIYFTLLVGDEETLLLWWHSSSLNWPLVNGTATDRYWCSLFRLFKNQEHLRYVKTAVVNYAHTLSQEILVVKLLLIYC